MFWFSFTRNKKRRILTQQAATPTSDLWDLVLDMDWERVLVHVNEHPVDAQWTDGHWHETPLYLACQHNPPVEVIRAIVEAYPRAAMSPSRANKDLPIHIACRYQVSEEILHALLKDFPVTAVEQTRWGRTPIMELWEFRPKDISSSDEALWRKMVVVLKAVARFRELPVYRYQIPRTQQKDFRGDCTQMRGKRSKIWDSNDHSDELFLVHAAVTLGALSCPVEVLECILLRFSEQVFIRDQWGHLPLDITVGPSASNPSTRRQYKPREKEFISLLLALNPGAANERIQMQHNRYPLHVALSNRHTWSGGVECLFHAAPEALATSDPLTKLYPFQQAAVSVRHNDVDLDTIFMLLRSRPDVLELMDLVKTSHSCSTSNTPARNSSRSGLDRCPNGIQDALLGTAAAFSIGSIVGIVFRR